MEDWCSSYRPCVPVVREGIRSDKAEVTYLRTFSAFNDDISLVKFQPDKTVDGPLAGGDGAGDELPLRGEEVAIVKDFAEFDGHELISEGPDVPVQSKTLQINVSST